jgi:Fe-S-cluster containining protein
MRKRHPELQHLTRVGWAMDRTGVDCVVLKRENGKAVCTLYDERPQTCRDFEAGSADCLAARQKTGVTTKLSSEAK